MGKRWGSQCLKTAPWLYSRLCAKILDKRNTIGLAVFESYCHSLFLSLSPCLSLAPDSLWQHGRQHKVTHRLTFFESWSLAHTKCLCQHPENQIKQEVAVHVVLWKKDVCVLKERLNAGAVTVLLEVFHRCFSLWVVLKPSRRDSAERPFPAPTGRRKYFTLFVRVVISWRKSKGSDSNQQKYLFKLCLCVCVCVRTRYTWLHLT